MELAIEAMGAITAVGDNLPLSVASIYTQARHCEALASLGPDGRAVIGAPTLIGDDVRGADRLCVMALMALRECAAEWMEPRLPMIVCAPPLDLFERDAAWLLRRLFDDAELPLDRDASRVVETGRGATLDALELAAQMLGSQEWPACILLGVDSLIVPARLAREVAAGRVAGPRNATGFVPGEGAAALLLSLHTDDGCPAIIAGRAQCTAGSVYGTSSAVLSAAVEGALLAAELRAPALGAVCHDGAGDWAQLEELAVSDRRTPLSLARYAQRIVPAISTGELGAAAGVLSLAVLSLLLSKGVLQRPALAMFSSEGASRGAAVLVPAPRDGWTPGAPGERPA
jgi:3-oxoacyl-[acyl-carrier-protein] synthase-1